MNNSLSQYFGPDTRAEEILTEIYSGRAMAENSVDYIVPDYIPDANKVLLCTAVPKIEGKYISGGTVELEGTVAFNILLATEDNTLSHLFYSEPFDAKVTAEGLSDNCIVMTIPSMEYITSRLVNPRKINIKYQVNTDIKIYCPVSLEPKISGIVSIEDEMNLQKSYKTVRTADFMLPEEKGIKVYQDIELDGSYPQAEEIILCKVRLLPNEIKPNEDGVEVKTDAIITCIYRTDDGKYFCAEKKFLLTKAINVEGSDYEWTARANSNGVTSKISPNSYGEMKIIELDFSYDLELLGMKNREVDTVFDIYSTKYEGTSEVSQKNATVFQRCFSSNVSVNSSSPRSEIKAENVKNIFTGTVKLKNVSSIYTKEKNKIATEGVAEVMLVCENNTEQEDGEFFSSFNYEYPFRCETDASDDLSKSKLSVQCSILDTKFRADSQNLYSDFEVSVKVTATEPYEVKYVSSARFDKESKIKSERAPFTLCYPSGDETLWDIAKRYKITVESIIEANNLSDEDISAKKVLLIPKTASKRPLFSKTI